MIVECPQCKAKARVDESRLGPQGAKVRCAKCKTVYPVMTPRPAPDEEEFGANKTSIYTADPITGEMLPGEFGGKSRPQGVVGRDSDSTSVADPAMLAKLRRQESKPAPPQKAAPRPATQPAFGDDDDAESTRIADSASLLREARGPAPPPEANGGAAGDANEDGESTRIADTASLARQANAKPPPSKRPQPITDGDATIAEPSKSQQQRQPPPPPPRATAPMPDMDAFEAPVNRVAPVVEAPVERTQNLKRPTAAQLQSPPSVEVAPRAESPRPESRRLVEPAPAREEAAPARRRQAPADLRDAGGETRAVEARPTLLAASTAGARRLTSGLAALAVLVLLGGMVVYVMGERLYGGAQQRWGDSPSVIVDASGGGDGVSLSAVRSLLYPGPDGHTLLLVTGEVHTAATPPAPPGLDTVVELRDRTGKVAESSAAPLGLPLDLADVVRVADRAAWENLVHGEQRRHNGPVVPPANASVPFQLAIANPPALLSDYVQAVHLAASAPPPAPPADAAPPTAPPVAPTPAEPPQSATPLPPPLGKDRGHPAKTPKPKAKPPHAHHAAHHADE